MDMTLKLLKSVTQQNQPNLGFYCVKLYKEVSLLSYLRACSIYTYPTTLDLQQSLSNLSPILYYNQFTIIFY
jgi:hypothetical protein